ncbi:uncharacterized vacuolar membrane protein YML018C-like [Eucalyptus grandis]|uniref:uncharacterized vacuolar membrane protein YML018C-like n=1 Tax=Eucalyptus grandis TaxID=71139 RepID=UPI00192EF9C7|nr:uncharacterized vacuolar membrane protein YML018C-like [Eucalyptus grandis]
MALEVRRWRRRFGGEDGERRGSKRRTEVAVMMVVRAWAAVVLLVYLSNAALARTSVASMTVLSSTSVLSTLFIDVLLGQDSLNVSKVVAVFISIAVYGNSLVADLFGLLSAMSYGLFTVWPLEALGLEPEFHNSPFCKMDVAVLANGLVGSVLSDYFWALSVVWTTPLVATQVLSLTIPFVMLADMVIHGRHYSALYILGSTQGIGHILHLTFG